MSDFKKKERWHHGETRPSDRPSFYIEKEDTYD